MIGFWKLHVGENVNSLALPPGVHEVMHVMVEIARGRGRPTQIAWLTDVAEGMGIRITGCVREADDRQKWRRIVKPSFKWPNVYLVAIQIIILELWYML